MRLSLLSLLAVAATAPAPQVHTVWITHLTTIQRTVTEGQEQATQTIHATETTPIAGTTEASIVTLQPTTTSETAETTKPTTQTKKSQTFTATTGTSESTITAQAKAATTSSTSPILLVDATSTAIESSTATSGTYSGEGTYYSPGLGACGETNTDSDYIVAIASSVYNTGTRNGNSNDNSYCGRTINAYYSGRSVQVTVVDSCGGCDENDLDFSPSAFTELADEELGRIDITWEWAD